jgi:hypothetical protein
MSRTNASWAQLDDLLTDFDERQAGTNLSGPPAAHIEDAGRRSGGTGPLLVDFGFCTRKAILLTLCDSGEIGTSNRR